MHISGQLCKQTKESDFGGQMIGMDIGIKGNEYMTRGRPFPDM